MSQKRLHPIFVYAICIENNPFFQKESHSATLPAPANASATPNSAYSSNRWFVEKTSSICPLLWLWRRRSGWLPHLINYIAFCKSYWSCLLVFCLHYRQGTFNRHGTNQRRKSALANPKKGRKLGLGVGDKGLKWKVKREQSNGCATAFALGRSSVACWQGASCLESSSRAWEGPYVVQEAYTNGSYRIVNCNGIGDFPLRGRFLKRYYA